jgi:hypothetical protein
MMANGAGKNWVRVVNLVTGFRKEFGVWPVELFLPSWLIQNLKEALLPEEFERIASRLQLTPQEPGMVAGDRNGRRHTYSIDDTTAEETESAIRWLGGRPDWSHSGDLADRQANQQIHPIAGKPGSG